MSFMSAFFHPAMSAMQRLRLLPKFIVLTVLLALPAALLVGLYVQELNKSVHTNELEIQGLAQIKIVDQLQHRLQQQRALVSLYKAGKTELLESIQQSKQEIQELFKEIKANSLNANLVNEPELAWNNIMQNFQEEKASDVYTKYITVFNKLQQARRWLTDNTNLSLDSEVESYHLIDILTRSIPELTQKIGDTVARSAPYIDFGVFQPGDDVQIQTNMMLISHGLDQIPTALLEITTTDPEILKASQTIQASLDKTKAFHSRTQNEILKSIDQTTSQAYLKAGVEVLQEWQTFSNQLNQTLEKILVDRSKKSSWNRNLVLFIMSAVFLLAAYLLIGFYRSFSQQIQALQQALEEVSQGNLSHPMQSEGKDELSVLMQGFEAMRLRLSHLVQDIRSGSDAIAHSSNEIALGNADLSQRTEQQATSLGTSAMAVSELNSAINGSVRNVQEVQQVSQFTTQLAHRGGQAIAKMGQRMQSIHSSSKKMSDIISVIDGIAFQTNILALNAAVEAARAGEQGRGFAVVASEVRNLAKRSADAAKEINQLISASVQEIQYGTQEVVSSEKIIKEIMEGIEATHTNMQNITQASLEQSTEMDKLNQNLGQLDEITQQNAALVEQAAAAADSMNQQAEQLRATLSTFKIEAQLQQNGVHPFFIHNNKKLPSNSTMHDYDDDMNLLSA
jgi:methyl-accepting chemotaxis protein